MMRNHHRRSKSNMTPLSIKHERRSSDTSALQYFEKIKQDVIGSNDEDKSGKRYLCSRCHQCKKGHVCTNPPISRGSVDLSQMVEEGTQIDLSITAGFPGINYDKSDLSQCKVLYPRKYHTITVE